MPDQQSLGRQVADSVKQRARAMAKDIAARIATPIDGTQPTRAQEVALWNLRNEQADPLQVEQLLAAGQHAQALDMVYPWRNRLIGPGSPTERVDRAEQLAQRAMEGQANA